MEMQCQISLSNKNNTAKLKKLKDYGDVWDPNPTQLFSFLLYFFQKQLSPKHHFKHNVSTFFLGIHNFEKI
jgi:hypothetical protein